MQGISMLVWKRVQVGVGRKVCSIGSPCPPEQFEATPLTIAANHYATLLTSLESAGNPYRYGRAKEIIPEYGGARRANGRPP
jgi:hypothetical protein